MAREDEVLLLRMSTIIVSTRRRRIVLYLHHFPAHIRLNMLLSPVRVPEPLSDFTQPRPGGR